MDVAALWDANATRYLEAIGLAILLYDHALTFADEVHLVWSAPASIAKYIFLFNRYLVPSTLIAVAAEMCGFLGDLFADEGCKQFFFVCSMIAVSSVGLANMLVLLRVVILWDHRPLILRVMTVAFVVSFVGQLSMMALALHNLIPGVMWSSQAHMCITTESSRIMVAVWAPPMLFEILVLVSTAANAIDRPISADTPLVKALHGDGIGYFLAVASLRAVNVALAAVARPSFTILGVFVIWAMTTTVLNRSLLRLCDAETQAPTDLGIRSASPFTLGRPAQATMDMKITESIIVIGDDVAELDTIWASRLQGCHLKKRSLIGI